MTDPNAPRPNNEQDDEALLDDFMERDGDQPLSPESLGDQTIPAKPQASPDTPEPHEGTENSDSVELGDSSGEQEDAHDIEQHGEREDDDLDVEPQTKGKDGGLRELFDRHWTQASSNQRARNAVIALVVVVAFYAGSDIGGSDKPGTPASASSEAASEDAESGSSGSGDTPSTNGGSDTDSSDVYTDLGEQPSDPDDVPSSTPSDSSSASDDESGDGGSDATSTASSNTSNSDSASGQAQRDANQSMVRDMQGRIDQVRATMRKQLIAFERRLEAVESQSQKALNKAEETGPIEQRVSKLQDMVSRLEQRIAELRATDTKLDERIAEVSVERTSARPPLRLVGFANPECEECVSHAIVYHGDEKRMLADGDTFQAFTVHINNDRMILAHNELDKRFSYYPRF